MRSVRLNFDVTLQDEVAEYVEKMISDTSFPSKISEILTTISKGGYVVTEDELYNIIEVVLDDEDNGETQTLSEADISAISDIITGAIQEAVSNGLVMNVSAKTTVGENSIVENNVEEAPVAKVVNFGDRFKDKEIIEEISEESDEAVDDDDLDMLSDMFGF